MKRKPNRDVAPVVPDQMLEQALAAAETDKCAAQPAKCVVCGSDTAPTSNEGLCWVCRRLKISAWRDNDFQMGAQE
ncbi:MAG: hypothetical protein IT163_05005 [Bryobacterales bacterium]|nr:hypothetical protein [Bryobacterales bacterium]